MVKKVLLFQHFDVCNNTFNDLTEMIKKEFGRCNIFYETINLFQPPDILKDNIENTLIKGFDAALSFNTAGQHNIIDENGISIFDKYEVPFFNWTMDSPIDLSGGWDSNCNNFYVLCVDRNHVAYIKKNFSHVKDAFFLPLPGIESVFLPKFENREFDVCFCGAVISSNSFYEKIKSYPEYYRLFILEMIDYMMSDSDVDMIEAFENVSKNFWGDNSFPEDDIENIRICASMANMFMRHYNRERVLKTLVNSNVNLHIFGGKNNEQVLGHGSGFVSFHGGVSFAETVNIFSNSKITLNVMPCFKNGTHDRIASGMLNKSIVLTDRSKYIDELPADIMCRYNIDFPNEVPDIINDIISNTEKYSDIPDNGYRFAKENYSIEIIIEHLLKIMENI